MNPDGVTEAVLMAEEACVAASLHVPASVVRSQGLEPSDFYLRGMGQIWGAALQMDEPSPVLLADLLPKALVEYQRLFDAYIWAIFPTALEAHASVVKRDSERRKAIAQATEQVRAINRGEFVAPLDSYRDEL